ncbi:HAD family hydrolase [Hymenobacter sp. GOD-10R]|uniref:D-glycero-alpha-D-manno-heptose-1,7-bisphosphate 7-phosphatase n=1 Tax=Hymenobacter sp. GOD-10R TaxID=3093922 RepID=UPI002D798F4E|nr:HAD family hydrolase [Hymenobacter sp. GOD-10R]WRQ30016.1 HAD family hydrolase [Hymenobacter sp. GOD-10R]
MSASDYIFDLMTNANSSALVSPHQHRAIFLDRDGVLNEEMGDYVWRPEDFNVLPGVPESLARLKAAGYYLIVVTNQAGIAKGLYTASQMRLCHDKLQQACGNLIDALYFAPSHPSVSESLSRKPGSLMLEKAIARFHLDPSQCWIVGDRLRDLEAGARVGVKGILVGHSEESTHQPHATNLAAATNIILTQENTY